jgi:hypothetical protein
MTKTDFRTELERLVDLYYALGGNWSPHGYTDTWNDALANARIALATPPPEPPTDEEIAAAIQKGADQEFYATVEALAEYCDCGVELTDSDAREVLYELRRPHIVLDCWGNEKHEGIMKT